MCVGVFDGNKRSLTIPSGHLVETPEIIKGTGQINFIEDDSINIMNLETYESIDVPWPTDDNIVKKIKELQGNPDMMSSAQVEYWQISGKTLINRVYDN